MFQLNKNTWLRLCEKISPDALYLNQSLIDIFLDINTLIAPEHRQAQLALNHLIFNVTEELLGIEDDFIKLETLSQFFCGNFSIVKNTQDPKSLLIATALESKEISPILASILFIYIADELGLKVVSLGIENNTVLKCTGIADSPIYVNLNSNGNILSFGELVKAFNNTKSNFRNGFPEAVETKDLLKIYLLELFKVIALNGQSQIKLLVLNTLLKAFPGSVEHYGYRALIYNKLNKRNEALKDLSKYFSFVSKEKASEELKSCYYNLKSLH